MAFELAQHGGQTFLAFAAQVTVGRAGAARELMPTEQEAHELRRRNGLDLGTQPIACVAVHAREQATVAPFVDTCRGERTAHHRTLGLEPQQRRQQHPCAEAERRRQRRRARRSEQIEATAHDLAQRVLGGGLIRHDGRDRWRERRLREHRLELVQAFCGDVQGVA